MIWIGRLRPLSYGTRSAWFTYYKTFYMLVWFKCNEENRGQKVVKNSWDFFHSLTPSCLYFCLISWNTFRRWNWTLKSFLFFPCKKREPGSLLKSDIKTSNDIIADDGRWKVYLFIYMGANQEEQMYDKCNWQLKGLCSRIGSEAAILKIHPPESTCGVTQIWCYFGAHIVK